MTMLDTQNINMIWVARAVAGKQDSRTAIKHIWVTPSRTVATDGHRLHIWNHLGGDEEGVLKPGFWVIKRKIKTMVTLELSEDRELQFPDLDRVIPKKAVKPLKLNHFREDAWYQLMQKQNEHKPEGKDLMLVNFDYFRDAFIKPKDNYSPDDPWELTVTGYGDALRLDRGPLTCILMPMRGGLVIEGL